MKLRARWGVIAVALWALLTLTLQGVGVTVLTAHLSAAAVALGVVLTVRLLRRRART